MNAILYKVSNMVYSGLLAGLICELIMPYPDDIYVDTNRRKYIIGSMVIGALLEYNRHQ
jgi:hypothetical protein